MANLGEYNLGYEAIASRVRDVLALEKEGYQGIRLRCVAFKNGGSWRNALCLIEGIFPENNIRKVFSGTLSDYLGNRKWLAVCGYALGALSKPLFAVAPGSASCSLRASWIMWGKGSEEHRAMPWQRISPCRRFRERTL